MFKNQADSRHVFDLKVFLFSWLSSIRFFSGASCAWTRITALTITTQHSSLRSLFSRRAGRPRLVKGLFLVRAFCSICDQLAVTIWCFRRNQLLSQRRIWGGVHGSGGTPSACREKKFAIFSRGDLILWPPLGPVHETGIPAYHRLLMHRYSPWVSAYGFVSAHVHGVPVYPFKF